MKKEPVLEVRNLSVSFKQKILIHDLSFSLEKGERLSISGKSGSGKSTLLNCLLGFVLSEKGTILIQGHKLDEQSVWSLRNKIGYVPQEPDLGNQSVKEFLKHPFQFKSNSHLSWNSARLKEFFELFHLEDELLDKKAALLSGGEKQRIALISALLLERKIYLLDEVTSALDDETKQAVIQYLKERVDLSLLFVTHEKEIKAMSRKTYILEKGQQ